MPYKDKNKQLENNKLWKRNKKIRSGNPQEIPDIPDHNDVPDVFYHDVRRFDLLYDTIQMKQRLAEKTRFNTWMSKHLDVLEEIQYIDRANVIHKQMKGLGLLTEWNQIPEHVCV